MVSCDRGLSFAHQLAKFADLLALCNKHTVLKILPHSDSFELHLSENSQLESRQRNHA
jgi:hypothetical protein